MRVHRFGPKSLATMMVWSVLRSGGTARTGADPLAVLLNGPSHGANYFSKKKLTIFWVGRLGGRRVPGLGEMTWRHFGRFQTAR
jgi:hypothetical protein